MCHTRLLLPLCGSSTFEIHPGREMEIVDMEMH